MLNISKGEPWVFWPSSICDTFPENPSNKLLSGDKNFGLEIEFSLNEITDKQHTVFTLLPRYTGLDIRDGKLVFTITYEDETKYLQIDVDLKVNQKYYLKVEHIVNSNFTVFINNKVVVNEKLKNKVFGQAESPHIIFGAGNFPKNNFNLNYTNFNLYSFKILDNNKIVTQHTFTEQIFDKFVDSTGNLNFIHKI